MSGSADLAALVEQPFELLLEMERRSRVAHAGQSVAKLVGGVKTGTGILREAAVNDARQRLRNLRKAFLERRRFGVGIV